MYQRFLSDCPRLEELLDRASEAGPITIAVAEAADPDVLFGLSLAVSAGVARALLVDDGDAIQREAEAASISLTGMEIVAANGDPAIAAVELVRQGSAQVLMKGMVSSGHLIRQVLDRNRGLRGPGLLSHVAIYDGPRCPRLWFMTDGGLNVAPDLETKQHILVNCLRLARTLGVAVPKVALLSALEKPDPAIPSSVDAGHLATVYSRDEFGPAVIEGPLALDVALSPEAARKKGVHSRVSGSVDVFLVPNIESGNILGKSMMYMAGATMAGVVMGATAPVLLNSRADTPAGCLASSVVAAVLARGGLA